MKNLGRSYAKLTVNLWQHYRYLTKTKKIRGKWCHLGNDLSEAVIGRILWAKNKWQPEWRFPKNAFEKWPTVFLRKSYEVISRWLTKDLRKSCDELRKHLTKILQSFENRAPGKHWKPGDRQSVFI